MSYVKQTRAHVDILRLDLELTTTLRTGPRFDFLEECRTNALAARVRGDPNVPQDREVTTAFQHRQPRSVESNGGPADSAARHASREQRPIRKVEAPSPMQRSFAIDPVVVLHVWDFEPSRRQVEAAIRASRHVQHLIDREGDGQSILIGCQSAASERCATATRRSVAPTSTPWSYAPKYWMLRKPWRANNVLSSSRSQQRMTK